MPQELAATPDGSEVWVTEAGPQTSTTPLWGVAVISTSSGHGCRQLSLSADPTDVAISPSGKQAYVTALDGLHVFDVATQRQVAFIPGLGSPQSVVVSPDGSFLYVTEPYSGQLATISTATDTVVRTTVGGRGAVAGGRLPGRLDRLRRQPELRFGFLRRRHHRPGEPDGHGTGKPGHPRRDP